ncbi:MAG: SDR family oxidoreductase [Sphingomonadales bacterium]
MAGVLAGRTVLITGASSGLGRHFAGLAAREGAKVVVAARRQAMLEDVVAEIASAGGQAHAVAMDVADEASVIAAYDAAQAAFGAIDTVIANAGISLTGLAVDMAADDFDKVMTVNARGVFLTAREGARRMLGGAISAEGRGRVVIVASIGALGPLPGLMAYSTSKAAALMIGKAMAREWVRKGINVNVLCPGYVETDLNRDWFVSDGGQRQIAGFPRRRTMAASDLDAMFLFLASDQSRAVTGAVHVVDDGQTL